MAGKPGLIAAAIKGIVRHFAGDDVVKRTVKAFKSAAGAVDVEDLKAEQLKKINPVQVKEIAKSRITEEAVEIGFTKPVQDKINKAGKKYMDEMDVMLKDEAYLTRVNDMLEANGIKSRTAKDAVSEGVGKSKGQYVIDVKDDIDRAMADKVYDRVGAELAIESSHFTNPERMADMVSQSSSIKKEDILAALQEGNPNTIQDVMSTMKFNEKADFNNRMFKNLVATKRLAFKNITPEEMTMDFVTKFFGTTEDAINFSGAAMYRAGLGPLARISGKIHGFNKAIMAFDTAYNRMGIGIKDMTQDVSEDNMRRIGAYIENIEKVGELIPAVKNNGVEANVELAKILELTPDEIAIANKTINFNRWLKYNEKQFTERAYGNLQVSHSFEDLPSDVIIHKENLSNHFQSDIGISYMHREITPEYRQELRDKGVLSVSNHDTYDSSNTLATFQRQRSETSTLGDIRMGPDGVEILDSARLPRKEEQGRYLTQYRKQMYDKHMDRFIDDAINASQTDQFLISDKSQRAAITEFKDLMENVRSRFHAANQFATKSDSRIVNLVSELVELDTAAALGGNPIMFLFNAMVQPFTNSAMYKGAWNVFAAEAKQAGPFVKALFKKGKKGGSFDAMIANRLEAVGFGLAENQKNPLMKVVQESYFTEARPDILFSEVHSSIDDQLFRLKVGGKNFSLSRLGKIISFPFMLSDIASRAIGLQAAVSHADDVFKRFGKDLQSKDPKVVNKIFKELHLDEFGFYNREKLVEVFNAGDKTEFIKRFAHESVDAEMFNYHRLNRPWLLDMAKQNKAVGMAFRFTSWPMYYANFMKGAVRSYSAGDKKPMLKLLAYAGAYMTAMSAATNVEDETIASIANYGIGRTPFFGPAAGAFGMLHRPIAGIALPSTSTLALWGIATMNEFKGQFKSGNETDSFEYLQRDMYNSAKNGPAREYMANIYEAIKGEE